MFTNRVDAGRQLAQRLVDLGIGVPDEDLLVLALPRGGVPIAAEVADALHAGLDVILVRKIGVPSRPELAMGAIGEGDVRVVNTDVFQRAGVTADDFAAVERRERAELERRASLYRGAAEPLSLDGRDVVIVDDGIATGSTARAACQVARARGARSIVLAVPVAPADWIDRLGSVADRYITLATPEPFGGVGRFYRDFRQVCDDEVIRRLTGPAES